MLSIGDESHPLTPTYQSLWKELVPASGKCETLEGELLRAVSRISHDYSNNGFGNNWSGALNYLDRYMGVPKGIIRLLKPYSRGKVAQDCDFDESDPIYVMIERLTVLVLEKIGDIRTPNPCDMFDLQEPGKF